VEKTRGAGMISTGSASQDVSNRITEPPSPATSVLGFLRLIMIVTQVEISFHPPFHISIENYPLVQLL
jgi:hypothetical protein